MLSGYQEVITDPSYAGQIITFTYPHIGNYGINATDFESAGTFCRGIVVRDLARRHSNFRAQSDLGSMLFQQGVPGIAGSTPGASPASSATVARCPVRLAASRIRVARSRQSRARHRRCRPRQDGDHPACLRDSGG